MILAPEGTPQRQLPEGHAHRGTPRQHPYGQHRRSLPRTRVRLAIRQKQGRPLGLRHARSGRLATLSRSTANVPAFELEHARTRTGETRRAAAQPNGPLGRFSGPNSHQKNANTVKLGRRACHRQSTYLRGSDCEVEPAVGRRSPPRHRSAAARRSCSIRSSKVKPAWSARRTGQVSATRLSRSVCSVARPSGRCRVTSTARGVTSAS